MSTKDERRAAFQAKNARRKAMKKRSGTIYAQEARELRRTLGGSFGREDPKVFNAAREGILTPPREVSNG